jgi:hypothetical protein
MSLDDIWTQISEFLKSCDLVFPATPDSGGDCPTAVWPHYAIPGHPHSCSCPV